MFVKELLVREEEEEEERLPHIIRIPGKKRD
jgi:hypothetical protein